MTEILKSMIAAIGIDVGKNCFHVVSREGRGAVALRRSGRVGRWKPASPICRPAS